MTHLVYQTPSPSDHELAVISLIDELRTELRHQVSEPRRWVRNLRRMTFARAVQGSNSIEGYNATLDDVVAVVDGQSMLDTDEETAHALAGYRDAMTYVLQVAQDGTTPLDEGLIKALHFMMIKHDLNKSPGLWRKGEIYVRRASDGEAVYKGPDAELVQGLVDGMVKELEQSTAPVLINAAMVHLNLVMIHPFRDGNGRMARCLQTLVLAREQIVAPVFSSIEEYLGHNTLAYYDILREVGRGGFNPQNDARPWIQFCLTAHYHQAKILLRRVREAELLWLASVELASDYKLPERTAAALVEASGGFRFRNSTYRQIVDSSMGEPISDLTASRDLKALVDSGLFVAVGERRARYYIAAESLRGIRDRIALPAELKQDADPFTVVSKRD